MYIDTCVLTLQRNLFFSYDNNNHLFDPISARPVTIVVPPFFGFIYSYLTFFPSPPLVLSVCVSCVAEVSECLPTDISLRE